MKIENLNENKTWVLVNKRKDKAIIEVKWVYKRKFNDVCKARLVVRGFQQSNVIDDIYAPVEKTQTLKTMLSFCCQSGFIIEQMRGCVDKRNSIRVIPFVHAAPQMDVVTAFLNIISSQAYVCQPKGYNDGSNQVCKLAKALYGLRESPRAWYECFDEYLLKLKFKRSNVDYCLYTFEKGDESLYLLLYLDDLLISSKSKKRIQSVKKAIMKKFKMKDLGEIKEYLRINVDYDINVR